MIFRRALIREFANNSVAVFLALLAIMLTVQLVRLLGRAAGGKIPSDAVLATLGFITLWALPLLLAVTLFIAIMLALVRSYRDSEMVIWLSSGQSLTAWLRPVLAYALPVVGLIALLSLVVSPWAAEKGVEYYAQLDTRDDVSQLSPGVFGEVRKRQYVYFFESVSQEEGAVRNVFVSSVQQGREGVMVSRTGRLVTAENGDRFVVLENGRRYEGRPGSANFRVTEFERYALRIQEKPRKTPELTSRSASTPELLAVNLSTFRGELLWRIGVPIAALVLALLAIPLSFVNPRAGRSLNLITALVIYMLYNNMISVTNSWVGQGKLAPGIGLWGLHVLMFGLVLVLFYRRVSLFSLRRLVR